jgi:uncharacterized protein YjbI with pentapeptide repeats
MPKILIVGTEEFEFPEESDNGKYGEEVTDWATAVSDALTSVQQRNDITTTTANILNNATVFTPITGFSFDTTEVISINCEFIVTRTTDVPAVNLVSSGFIQGNFDGSAWNVTVEYINDAGVEFDVSASGQVVYKSSNLTGSNYTGSILFKAKVFNQPE